MDTKPITIRGNFTLTGGSGVKAEG